MMVVIGDGNMLWFCCGHIAKKNWELRSCLVG